MKIGPLEPKTIAAPATTERKAAPQPASTEPSAQVKLSNAAQGLQAAEGDATFDNAKVERIAQAIRDGQFKVNPEAIADKLIVNAQELLSRKPS
ncbi:MAG: flagellar biosynthesis anti-sigma factor FlgM [Betaproteobacteria bacterium]|jgi:negative regulator of flagellin synthesis FlgM